MLVPEIADGYRVTISARRFRDVSDDLSSYTF
jgi:hypothetical protein